MSDFKIPQDKLNDLLAICEEHGNQPGELINILHKAQHLFGYLPAEVQKVVAHQLQIPVSKVYGVVTFYSLAMYGEQKKYWMNSNGNSTSTLEKRLPMVNFLFPVYAA